MAKIRYKINGKKYRHTIPTSFNDITIEQYESVRGKGMKEALMILTGITEEALNGFHEQTVIDMLDVLSFLNEEAFVCDDMHGLVFEDVDKLRCIQFEHWKVQHLKDKSVVYMMALLHSGDYNYPVRMAEVEKLRKLPASVGLYCQNFYNNSLENHIKKYSSLYEKYDPSDEELDSGYEQLGKWGMYLTIKKLSGGNILKMPEVWMKTVQEVYTFIASEMDENNYKSNLYELHRGTGQNKDNDSEV